MSFEVSTAVRASAALFSIGCMTTGIVAQNYYKHHCKSPLNTHFQNNQTNTTYINNKIAGCNKETHALVLLSSIAVATASAAFAAFYHKVTGCFYMNCFNRNSYSQV